jgi:tetratricopeptide (TPR) repeat protein
MRKAYSGRAAAYEKKGELEKALADHQMVVLYYALEAEILTSLDSPDRGRFFGEAAQAYKTRSDCLEALGRTKEAASDRKRADGLIADAKKLEAKAPAVADTGNQTIQIHNTWPQAVTMVIAGVTYRLESGEQKTISVSSASVSFEMQAGSTRTFGNIQAGKTYTIRPAP